MQNQTATADLTPAVRRAVQICHKIDNRLGRLGALPEVVLGQKLAVPFAASATAIAALSPIPSIVFNAGMSLPSIT